MPCVCASCAKTLFSVTLDLAGIGVSLVTAHARELAYITLQDIDMALVDGDIDQCVQVTFGRYAARPTCTRAPARGRVLR